MQTANIDISQNGTLNVFQAMQGDTDRQIQVSLFDAGSPYNVGSAAVSVWYDNFAGNAGNFNNGISVSGNTITITLNGNLTAAPGNYGIVIMLNESGGKISSWNIGLIVGTVPGYGSAAAGDYFEAFQAGELAAQINTLNARISTIIANGTPTQGNTELIDIRTGADGKVYPTAGDAVRGQVKWLNTKIQNVGFPKIIPLSFGNAVPEPTEVNQASYSTLYGSNYEVSLHLSSGAIYGIVGFELAESYRDLEGQEIIAVVKNIGQSPVDTTLMLTNSTTGWNNSDKTAFRLTDFRLSLDPGEVQTVSFVPSDYQSKYQANPQAAQRFCVLAAKYNPADSNTQDLLLCFYNATQFARYQGFDSDRVFYPLRAVKADLADGVTDSLRKALVDEVAQQVQQGDRYITCWGDSLTAQGGWTTTLQNLCGMPVYNGGTGGETCRTILARQGGDVMVVNDIEIPAQKTPVVLANRTADKGVKTWFGNNSTPLLQGGTEHVNPCLLGTVEGTLAWAGADHAGTNGSWLFTRNVEGDAITIDRPTALRTNFDRNRNSPYLMIIFMGQNGGYTSNEELVWQHQRMIDHAQAEHVLVLGFSTGSASGRSAYEKAMQQAFGRYFLSLRQYLAHPIYDGQGTEAGNIVSCYGLADAGLTPTAQDLEAIRTGTVPPQCTLDGIHYTTATKTVIGKLIYKYCRELNIF